MSKKGDLFALLDQGKTLDSPEVKALGLQPAGLKAYVKMWSQQQGVSATAVMVEESLPPEPAPELIPEPAPPLPKTLTLDSLPIASFFTKGGKRYRVATKSPDTIICHLLVLYHGGTAEGGTVWKFNKTVSMTPNTIVEQVVEPKITGTSEGDEGVFRQII